MANVFGAYDPVFYANEALIWLKKKLNFGSLVHRGYDPAPSEPGSVITIRRPMTFTAASMPASATDLTPDSVSITLDQWFGVTYALTDKELAYTKERVIAEHIAPAAYAVADKIDTTLAQLYKDIPWSNSVGSALAVTDITAARQRLSINQAPMSDGRLNLGLTPTHMKEALDLTAFTQWQGAGADGAATQASGIMGQKFGFTVFENQNVQTHTSGVSADATGALTANAAVGATSIALDSVTTAGTFKAGDHLIITGDSQRYAITADATASSGAVTLSIYPPLKVAAASTTVVTITLDGAGTGKEISIAFHRDAFALAMGVLPDNLPGADVFTVTDPQSGLSIRARRWYVGADAKTYMGLDALWGKRTLNPNLAVRMFDA